MNFRNFLYNKTNLYLITFLIVILNSCSIRSYQADTKDLQNLNKITIYKTTIDSTFKDVKTGEELSILSLKRKKLFDWLESNEKRWHKMPSNYASIDLVPPILTVQNDKFTLSIYKTFVILTYSDKNYKKIVISKDISIDDFKFLNDKF
jgi:hypothetical protein